MTKRMKEKTIRALQDVYHQEINTLRAQYDEVVQEFADYRKVNEKL